MMARCAVSGARGDLVGSWTGRVLEDMSARANERAVERATRVIASAERDVVRWMFVESAARCRSAGTHRLLMALVADLREDSDDVRRDVAAIGMLTQMLVTDATVEDVLEVASSLLEEDFAKVWRVGLWSNLSWRDAWRETKRLESSESWKMIAALCRNTRVDDLRELEDLARAVIGAQHR